MKTTPAKVLFADDSMLHQRLIGDILSQAGMSVRVANNGVQAVHLVQIQRPDIILLNVQMPRMDGFVACRILKNMPEFSSIPIIFLSDTDSIQDRIVGFAIGGADFINKAIHPLELTARIRVHLPAVKPVLAPGQFDESLTEVDKIELATVNAAKNLIADRLEAIPNLTEMARSVGTYREKLTELFQKHMGCTVFKYVRNERINRGKELLETTRMQIGDIASLVGFENPASFATSFKDVVGESPTTFRKNMKL